MVNEKVFTFWEGAMPDYIKACLATWRFDFKILNYDNLNKYTDLRVDNRLKSFLLSQVSDAVRAHVLRDNGGYWLDADTIMVSDDLPAENVIGDPIARTHSTGVSHFTEQSKNFFIEWAKYQDRTIADPNHSKHWSVLVNMFTDPYVKAHNEVTIYDIRKCRPELDMIKGGDSRSNYVDFYFNNDFNISDVPNVSMFVLHNSWTPNDYKWLPYDDLMRKKCTMSNILREVLV